MTRTPIAAVVTESNIGSVAAALARIEEIAEELCTDWRYCLLGTELLDLAQELRDSIALIDDTPKEE